MQKPATIKDIASLVGVSTSTVSAVLGPRESRHVRVSENTRAQILEAAERLKYRPNRMARSLRGEKTNVIGLYTAYGYLNPHVQFTGQILGGLHLGCDENRKDLLVHGLYAGRRPDEIYGELTDGWIDGLVVYTRPDDPLVALLS
jgi:DNA-binding LacI/PurR family transcriptional regulator